MDEPVPEQDRVAWAVAAHRALIKTIGPGAPAMITGAYPEGARRPANRIALHMLGAGVPAQETTAQLAHHDPGGPGSR